MIIALQAEVVDAVEEQQHLLSQLPADSGESLLMALLLRLRVHGLVVDTITNAGVEPQRVGLVGGGAPVCGCRSLAKAQVVERHWPMMPSGIGGREDEKKTMVTTNTSPHCRR
jgi:hypothetical protein